MTPAPPRLDGKTRMAQTINQLSACIRELQAIKTPNSLVSRTTRGTIQLPAAKQSVAGVESSQPVWQ